MKTIKAVSAIVNGLYTAIIFLFLLDVLTPCDIKSQSLKSFAYIGLLIGTPVLLVLNLFLLKPIRTKILGLLLPVLALLFIIVVGPLKIMFSSGAWHTQTVLYQNGHVSFKRIEYQMQDIGALGYNRRTVEVLYLTKLLMIVSAAPPDADNKVEWIKVNEDVNELGLKEP